MAETSPSVVEAGEVASVTQREAAKSQARTESAWPLSSVRGEVASAVTCTVSCEGRRPASLTSRRAITPGTSPDSVSSHTSKFWLESSKSPP